MCNLKFTYFVHEVSKCVGREEIWLLWISSRLRGQLGGMSSGRVTSRFLDNFSTSNWLILKILLITKGDMNFIPKILASIFMCRF